MISQIPVLFLKCQSDYVSDLLEILQKLLRVSELCLVWPLLTFSALLLAPSLLQCGQL